ncbi:MBL fold metallo-hydrolase [Paenibacillus hexagrammi]|uniref:MBL fold metallo-hydrolase n=1 Tax=Paenibacillus hexagrammi TaxID=2908839 RepID=UPI0021A399D8|nr:MBL fold metallo-hydrolase [Paenibacillus sp. YPD9-1]
MLTTIEHSDDILQVKVPLPFPLRWVNSYLVRGSAGWTLIDPGLRTPEAEALWHAVLQERGIAFEHIEQVVLTHHHPDHYGLAGWFQERTGAPVLLSETGWRQVQLMWQGSCRCPGCSWICSLATGCRPASWKRWSGTWQASCRLCPRSRR